MGDIFGDAKISNTFWCLKFLIFFFLGGVGGGRGKMNGKCWTRAYV